MATNAPLPSNGTPSSVELVQKIIAGTERNRNNSVNTWEQALDKTWERLQTNQDGSLTQFPPLFESLDRQLTNHNRAAALGKAASKQSTEVSVTMLRSVALCLDFSDSILEGDIRPTRYDFLAQISSKFISQYLEQHPLSEISTLISAKGVCHINTEPRSLLSTYTHNLIHSAQRGGCFSLCNTIINASHILLSSSSYYIREILIVTFSINTIDPYDLQNAIILCKEKGIIVHIIGWDARVHIFDTVATETGGTYSILYTSQALQNALYSHLSPPIIDVHTSNALKQLKKAWIPIAFPTLVNNILTQAHLQSVASYDNDNNTDGTITSLNTPRLFSKLVCMCHKKQQQIVYLCPQCSTPVCRLPSPCPCCGSLLLSYHHLSRVSLRSLQYKGTRPVFYPQSLLASIVKKYNDAQSVSTTTDDTLSTSSALVLSNQSNAKQQPNKGGTKKKRLFILGSKKNDNMNDSDNDNDDLTTTTTTNNNNKDNSNDSVQLPVNKPKDTLISLTYSHIFTPNEVNDMLLAASMRNTSASTSASTSSPDTTTTTVPTLPTTRNNAHISSTTGTGHPDLSPGPTALQQSQCLLKHISNSGNTPISSNSTIKIEVDSVREDKSTIATTTTTTTTTVTTTTTMQDEMSSTTTTATSATKTPSSSSSVWSSALLPHQSIPECLPILSPTTQCTSLIVRCIGCSSPAILPPDTLLESAAAYSSTLGSSSSSSNTTGAAGQTAPQGSASQAPSSSSTLNIPLCSCDICKNCDLVTTCLSCGSFLCSCCDQLLTTMLQYCPGCDNL